MCEPSPTLIAQASNLCLNSVITVFRADATGVPSLEIVRLLNRMIKERRFAVHPNVLTCLLHLRLKSELGVRASEAKAEREEMKREKPQQRKKSKVKGAESTHLSKKAKKALKEKKEIEKELKVAEASVDKEERSSNVSLDGSLRFDLSIMRGHISAHRDPEAPVRSVLPHSEEPGTDSAATRRSPGHLKIRPSRQRRLLPGPNAGAKRSSHARATRR